MKAERDRRTEVASVRLTKAERARLDAMGGPSAALRKILRTKKESISYRVARRCGPGSTYVVWDDGTIGPNYPRVVTR